MKSKKALIVVDAQNDFMPFSEEEKNMGMGGALAVPNGDKIVPIINKLLPEFNLVIFTKDWHPRNMEAFASTHGKKVFDTYTNAQGGEDILWPDHCVQGTQGADLHSDIDFSLINGDFYIFKKGLDKNYHPYSGFGANELDNFLKEKGIEELIMVGLAMDFCLGDTAIDAAKKGYKTTVIKEGTKSINSDVTKVIEKFKDNEINFISINELLN